jgi:hypothetical protein
VQSARTFSAECANRAIAEHGEELYLLTGRQAAHLGQPYSSSARRAEGFRGAERFVNRCERVRNFAAKYPDKCVELKAEALTLDPNRLDPK